MVQSLRLLHLSNYRFKKINKSSHWTLNHYQDDGDDVDGVALAPGIHLLTTDSPEKTLYDIYSFGSNSGFMLGINQSANNVNGRNAISIPVKVSINL